MSFAGSVQAMIISLKNNARKKHRAQKLLKENERLISGSKKKLKFKQVSDKEIEQIKTKIQAVQKKERKKQIIVLTTIITPILFVLIWFAIISFQKINEQNKRDKIFQQELLKKQEEKINQDYNFYLNDGYIWFNEEKYRGAKTQFNEALKLKPKNYQASIALLKAYVYDCLKNNHDCQTTEKLLLEFEKTYSGEKDFIEIKKYYLDNKQKN